MIQIGTSIKDASIKMRFIDKGCLSVVFSKKDGTVLKISYDIYDWHPKGELLLSFPIDEFNPKTGETKTRLARIPEKTVQESAETPADASNRFRAKRKAPREIDCKEGLHSLARLLARQEPQAADLKRPRGRAYIPFE